MKRYDRQGLLALDPQAFFGFFAEDSVPANTLVEGVAIVSIRGPLEHHRGWCDNYDAIRDRVGEACAGPAGAVVLRIDSPGGDVSGCFDAARALRAMCAAAGKPLFAYIDGSACSAAYALAAAAERIVASPTGSAGSVGVIATRVDATAADEKFGVKFAFLTSGARKTYGNPHVAMDEHEAVETRRMVDWLASEFFELVAELRGLDPKAVADLEAGVFRGPEAVSTGLVDELGTFEGLLASINRRPEGRANEGTMDAEEKAARKALQSIVDSDDADEKAKARAKKALAAMDDEDKGDDDEKAEGDEEEPSDDDEKDAKASVSASTAGELAGRVSALELQLEAQARGELIASRPDLSPGLVKLLATKPLSEVRAIINAIEKPKKPKLGDAAAAAQVGGTRGEGQGDSHADRQAPEAAAAMDRAMGLAPTKLGTKREGPRLFLGASIPDDKGSAAR